MKIQLKLPLYIFPLVYLILGFYFRQIFGDLSLRSTDPDYIYFISGMCVSTGQFDQANIDHPGSALQLVLGLVFRLIYLIRGKSLPFFEDAMIHSDLYLSVGNLMITVILALALLWAGISVYKITKNYVYAVIIQTGPFLIEVWYEIIGRIYPELFILIPLLILQVQILKLLYQDNQMSTKDILIFSFAIAMGMAVKMTFLPFAIIPLLLLRSAKAKLQFLFSAILFFLIIALPVTFQLEKFWNWMKGIFIHSGMYESGAKNVVDLNVFAANLQHLVSSQKPFFIVLSVFIISLLVLFFMKSPQAARRKILINIGLSLIITLAGAIFIISKQFAIRYFMPALLLYPFLLILISENIQQFFKIRHQRLILNILIAMVILMGLRKHMPYLRIASEGIGKDMQARMDSRNFIKTLPRDSYKIIATQDYGCPFQEYSAMYCFCVGGKEWPGHVEIMNSIYPDTYFHFTGDNTIRGWGDEFDPEKVIHSGKPVYLYLEKNNAENFSKTIGKLFEKHPEFKVEKEILFENPVNGEGILQLFIQRDTAQPDKTI